MRPWAQRRVLGETSQPCVNAGGYELTWTSTLALLGVRSYEVISGTQRHDYVESLVVLKGSNVRHPVQSFLPDQYNRRPLQGVCCIVKRFLVGYDRQDTVTTFKQADISIVA